jgi:hypothetical protein
MTQKRNSDLRRVCWCSVLTRVAEPLVGAGLSVL